jgi:hypothetical protein
MKSLERTISKNGNLFKEKETMSTKSNQALWLDNSYITEKLSETVAWKPSYNTGTYEYIDRPQAIAIINHLKQVFEITDEELNNSGK